MASTDADARLRPLYRPALIVFGMLLVIRSLSVFSVYFFHVDEVSIAAGAAALVRDNIAGVYHYTPQLGYYRLVEWIDLLLGGDVSFIPGIIKALSALAGAVIPTLGLFAFANELSVRERWLAVLSLAVNPIIWTSSQYGNTAMVATALATAGLVILSNTPRPIARIGGLALVGAATFVRADSVLLAPLVLFLLYRSVGSWGSALLWSACFGGAMLLAYAAILMFDPRADNAAAAVASHLTNTNPKHFWSFVLWTMSPIPLVFAIWGMYGLRQRPPVLVALLLWCLPTLLFYAPAATIPRYFLNIVVPLSMAAAAGLAEAARRLPPRLGSLSARIAIAGLATAHLIVGFGYLTRGHRVPAPFAGGDAPTQEGEVLPTGALIYRTIATRGILAWSLPSPQFESDRGAARADARDARGRDRAAADRGDPAGGRLWLRFPLPCAGGRRALRAAAGARSIGYSRRRHTGCRSAVPRVETIAWRTPLYTWIARFDVVAGDEIWVLGRAPFPDAETLKKMPPGLSLVAATSFHPEVRVFRVAGGSASSS